MLNFIVSDENIYIHGFGLQGYRSFGGLLQKIGPFSKINLFIGQNNSGKSNVLRFIHKYYFGLKDDVRAGNRADIFDSTDVNVKLSKEDIAIAFAHRIDEPHLDELLASLDLRLWELEEYVKAMLTSKWLSQGTDCTWFTYYHNYEDRRSQLDTDLFSSLVTNLNSCVVHEGRVSKRISIAQLANALESRANYSDVRSYMSLVLTRISPTQILSKKYKVDVIPAFRKIGNPEKLDFDHSGEGIIDKLAQLQNPNLQERHLKEQFNKIEEFVREVTGNSTARLEIPYERNQILVEMDGKILPLESLGTGIHEVIILAAAATILRNQVVCVEEPELHLHPLLQKKLVRFLAEKTNNQYFISTHSAHLLDTPEASIFHVQLKNGQSEVRFVKSDREKSLICNDLGYRASDILQTNCVIWVEGPSDRTYLNYWINAVDGSLIEGVHYSIMFYGGRLLSHLSADDPEVTDFISLRRLNRHICILIDRDRENKRKRINETKRRVKEEFNEGPGFAWITEGREVENYVDADLLEQAVKKVHPSVARLVDKGDYDNRLKRYRNAKNVLKDTSKDATVLDKVKIAHEVSNYPADLDVLDLKEQVKKLTAFIREANNF